MDAVIQLRSVDAYVQLFVCSAKGFVLADAAQQVVFRAV